MSDISEVRIICDIGGTKHSAKRPTTLVAAFQYIEDGRWTTRIASARLQKERTWLRGSTDVGLTLAGDEVFNLATHGMRPESGTRSVYPIRCEKCGQFSVDAREETLFAVLNTLRHAHLEQISLRALAARLDSMPQG
jgi:hypothetical protein